MHSAERFHTFCNFKQLHCFLLAANQLTYTLPICTKLLHCYFLFNRTVANIVKRSLKDCLITQNDNNRIFLTRMCLQVHVNVHIITVEYLVLFKKLRLFDWISVFRRLEAECSAHLLLLCSITAIW